jgi:hypothetical protein
MYFGIGLPQGRDMPYYDPMLYLLQAVMTPHKPVHAKMMNGNENPEIGL